MSSATLGAAEMPVVIRGELECAGNKVGACRGNSAWKTARPCRQGGASAAGKGGPVGFLSAAGWGGLSPPGREVRRLQKPLACFPVPNPTSGFSKVSAVVYGVSGAEADGCGGSLAWKLGRAGGRERTSAAEHALQGLLWPRGRRSSLPSLGAVSGLQRLSVSGTVSASGFLKQSAANPRVLEVPLERRDGLEEAGGKVEGLGEAGLLPGSTGGLIRGEVRADKMELHSLPPARAGQAPRRAWGMWRGPGRR